MTSIHPPRATAAIENELLSIASQVHVWGANWNVNDRSIFVLTLTLQSTRTLSSLQGAASWLPGFLAVWLLYGWLACLQTACLMLAWCPCPHWSQMQNIESKMSMIVQFLSWHLHFNWQELFQAYRGLLSGFLASWLSGCCLLYGWLACLQTACLMLAWCPCPHWFQMQNIESKINKCHTRIKKSY